PLGAYPVARTRTATSRPVAGIGELTAIQRQAAAADALGERRLEPLQLDDAGADPLRPLRREFGPVRTVGHAIPRKSYKLGPELVERQADPLRKDDERDAPNDRTRIAAVAGVVAFRVNQALIFIETQRRRRRPAAPGHLADCQDPVHEASVSKKGLDFK